MRSNRAWTNKKPYDNWPMHLMTKQIYERSVVLIVIFSLAIGAVSFHFCCRCSRSRFFILFAFYYLHAFLCVCLYFTILFYYRWSLFSSYFLCFVWSLSIPLLISSTLLNLRIQFFLFYLSCMVNWSKYSPFCPVHHALCVCAPFGVLVFFALFLDSIGKCQALRLFVDIKR